MTSTGARKWPFLTPCPLDPEPPGVPRSPASFRGLLPSCPPRAHVPSPGRAPVVHRPTLPNDTWGVSLRNYSGRCSWTSPRWRPGRTRSRCTLSRSRSPRPGPRFRGLYVHAVPHTRHGDWGLPTGTGVGSPSLPDSSGSLFPVPHLGPGLRRQHPVTRRGPGRGAGTGVEQTRRERTCPRGRWTSTGGPGGTHGRVVRSDLPRRCSHSPSRGAPRDPVTAHLGGTRPE